MHVILLCMIYVLYGISCEDMFGSYKLNYSQFNEENDCPEFPSVQNANIKIESFGRNNKVARIYCFDNYDLVGNSDIYCVFGQWEYLEAPRCQKTCSPPPFLENAKIVLGKKAKDIVSPTGKYRKGTVVTYTCISGYTLIPAASHMRVCNEGNWTGSDGFCKPDTLRGCPPPKAIENGQITPNFFLQGANVGEYVFYQCNSGYSLVGHKTVQCNRDGAWEPDPPMCQNNFDAFPGMSCNTPPFLNPSDTERIEEYEINAISGATVEIGCKGKYRNTLSPCQSSKFYCKNGKWFGVYPQCDPVHDCLPPPPVSYAVIIDQSYGTHFDSHGSSFPIHSKITYECLKGYVLKGNPVITCTSNGCWEPTSNAPMCIKANDSYFYEVNNINAILISTATGAGVLGILLLACLVVACRKRRTLARAVNISTPPSSRRHPHDVLNDHAVLLQHPDRLALIAFAEGVQTNQANSLPSYDEATRSERTVSTNLITVNRVQHQRPHWPILAVCRGSGRGRSSSSAEANSAHVVRHGSCASHTPSTRSGGDSMGSTDTMALSEGSTVVTLDTASSHSGTSQNPSCRAHCGSLASFDGCSIINTEDVPLLEESELEDIQGGSNDVENPISADEPSCKVSTNSGPVMTV
ncbi:P-selectin-like [Cylas formicarius]|uniref:P-selectin-like n=1 Tax=Cylas formicarius TaxID=197179 RepID=UPI00295847A3|nr:P-selectin-like [Cylas formicarius]